MATGILPDKYQAYRNGQISYEEATGQKSNIPAPAAPKPTSNNGTPYSQGNNYGVSYTPNTSAPAVYAPAPSYASSAPSYSVPAPASSYTGSSSIIGSVAGSKDLAKSYQDLYNSTRNSSNQYSQQNTWADNKGNVYDTTSMSPQQTYALMLAKDNNPNAAAILKGMGLDMNGNPTSPMPSYGGSNRPPTPAETKSGGSYLNASSGPVYAPPANTNTNVNAPKLGSSQQSAMDWINSSSSGQGGLANYVKGQQAKYDAAIASGDQDMLSRLNADMQRVGYSLNTGAPQNEQTAQTGQTAPNNPYGLSNDQYNALMSQADAQLGQQRSSLAQSVNSAISGLRNSNDYVAQLTKDNRAIEDSQFKETNNPFNGMTSYRAAMNDRNRSIQDTAANKDYSTQVSALQQKLADFDAGSAAQKQAIVNQLAQQLLQTNVQTGQLTGTYNGQRTVQGQQLDLSAQNQQFNQQQDVKKQRIDLANFLTQQTGVTVYPTEDPMLSYAQVAGIPTVAAQKMAQDAANMSFDNAIKKALAENTINKTQADIMQQAQQLSISQQNANTSAYSASASAGNAAARLAWDKDPNNPDNIYKMSQSNKPKTTDYKTDPNFASDVSHLKSSPTDAAKLDSNPQPFIDAYGYDGYLALRKAAGLDD